MKQTTHTRKGQLEDTCHREENEKRKEKAVREDFTRATAKSQRETDTKTKREQHEKKKRKEKK